MTPLEQKVDVVVPYYRQANELARLWRTIDANTASIGKVLVVNDELWKKPELDSLERMVEGSPLPVEFLDHEHNGFGITRSVNQGMVAATTEYVLVVSSDGLLPTGIIQKKLAAVALGPTLISGPCHHVTPDSNPDDPAYIHMDRYEHLRKVERWQLTPWRYMRGINRLVRRLDWLEIGGMDERFDERNYEDFEFVARWITNFGFNSVMWEETPVLHQGVPATSAAPYPLKSAILFAQQLIALRKGAVLLLSDRSGEWSPDFVCIGEAYNQAVDVALPCQYPNWLQACEVAVLRCNAFHQIDHPEHWFQAFAFKKPESGVYAGPGTLELSPVQKKDLSLFARYGYTIVGQDTVDRSVRAIRKDLL